MQPASLSQLFDRGASRYDLLVGLCPGYHPELRRAASALAERVGSGSGPRSAAGRVTRLLDLACGSGASTTAMSRAFSPPVQVLGVDASDGMLDQARAKPWPDGVDFVAGRIGELEVDAFGAGAWDGALAAYLFRNVPSEARDRALGEVFELLRPGGWLVVQEYSVAGRQRATWRWHLVCWLVIIPLGVIVDRNPRLYRYLWRSVLDFDSVGRFSDRLLAAGFEAVAHRDARGWQRGILHTFVARKPAT